MLQPRCLNGSHSHLVMGMKTRLGVWLILAAAGPGRPQSLTGAALTSWLPAWPVVLDTGNVYVCTANISYHLPETLTDIQERYEIQNLIIETSF